MKDFLPRTPINHLAKFDAVAFSSAEKSVTIQTHKNKLTVTFISTPCPSACVDKKFLYHARNCQKEGVGSRGLPSTEFQNVELSTEKAQRPTGNAVRTAAGVSR